MALSVEQLAEIMVQLEVAAVQYKFFAQQWRAEAALDKLPPQEKEMREKGALRCDVEAAKCRGLIAAIEEELGHETDPA